MKLPFGTIPRSLIVLVILAAALTAPAADLSPIVPAGDGTYRITATASHKFTRNTAKLKDEALAAATAFCAKDGKTLKVVSIHEDKAQYLVGRFPQVRVTFQAVAADEAGPASTATAPAATGRLSVDGLREELTKLDEMRKSGLLTDAEFEALKQRVISRF